MMFIVK